MTLPGNTTKRGDMRKEIETLKIKLANHSKREAEIAREIEQAKITPDEAEELLKRCLRIGHMILKALITLLGRDYKLEDLRITDTLNFKMTIQQLNQEFTTDQIRFFGKCRICNSYLIVHFTGGKLNRSCPVCKLRRKGSPRYAK